MGSFCDSTTAVPSNISVCRLDGTEADYYCENGCNEIPSLNIAWCIVFPGTFSLSLSVCVCVCVCVW